MERRTVTITLQVEVDGDDVRGWARAEAARGAAGAIEPAAEPAAAEPAAAEPAAADRAVAAPTPADAVPPRPFAGWLGLIGSVDALLGFPPDAGAAARALAAQDATPAVAAPDAAQAR
jgi:hypothetical protein